MADPDDRFHPPVFGLMARAILQALDGSARTANEVARTTELPVSTVIRVAAILRDLGLVEGQIEGGTLRIGPVGP